MNDQEPTGPVRATSGRRARSTSKSPDRVAALIDARFWAWLQDDDEASVAEHAREALQDMLQRHDARLVRTLWYTDQDVPSQARGGPLVRRVPSNAQDNGVTLLRAMAQDLAALAEHQSVERVLLVSDDDRLLLAVDDAQRRGLMVDMLVDAQSSQNSTLREDEPGWASLLQQADRVMVLGEAEPQWRHQRPRTTSSQSTGRSAREAPSAEFCGIVETEVRQWWQDATIEQRGQWQEAIEASRGLPQDLDRQLLLQISRRLGQALSPAEKAAMRQTVRQQVLGEGAAAPRTPEDA
jgi:hypothetical protein